MVRLDGANRAFLGLVLSGSLLLAYAVCGVLASDLVPMLSSPVARTGGGALIRISALPAVLLLALVMMCLARGAHALGSCVLASRHVSRTVRAHATETPDRLLQALRAIGLDTRVVVVTDPEPISFVCGMLRARVVVSSALLNGLSDVELRAALEHERYHVANLDPLKTLVVRVLTATLPFAPGLKPLQVRYLAARELAADRRAVGACGVPSLAGALLQAVQGPGWTDGEAVVSLASGMLPLRLAQLETGKTPALDRFTVARTGIAVTAWIGLITIALAVVAGRAGSAALGHADLVAMAGSTLVQGIICAAPFVAGAAAVYGLLALGTKHRSAVPRAVRAE